MALNLQPRRVRSSSAVDENIPDRKEGHKAVASCCFMGYDANLCVLVCVC